MTDGSPQQPAASPEDPRPSDDPASDRVPVPHVPEVPAGNGSPVPGMTRDQWRGSMIGLGIALGAGVGTAIGVATDDLATWLAVGIGAGIAIGSGIAYAGRPRP